MSDISQSEQTHFGFQDIPVTEKTGKVRDLFSGVANKYDLMNDILSFGAHRIWKNLFLQKLAPRPNKEYLDLAGGTGDIAERILSATGNQARVTIFDLTFDMLAAGKERKFAQEAGEHLKHICGDAENLPFPDKSFDAVTISFGIRNVTRPEVALREAYRVLKPCGKFLCLEFSEPTTAALRKLYDFYSFEFMPRAGKIVAGDADSYRYLAESIRKFPNQPRFAAMMTAAGFQKVDYRNLSGGITAIHSGFKYI